MSEAPLLNNPNNNNTIRSPSENEVKIEQVAVEEGKAGGADVPAEGKTDLQPDQHPLIRWLTFGSFTAWAIGTTIDALSHCSGISPEAIGIIQLIGETKLLYIVPSIILFVISPANSCKRWSRKAVWWVLVCTCIVPLCYPLVVFSNHHDSAKNRAVFAYIHGIMLLVVSIVLSQLFARYRTASWNEVALQDLRKLASEMLIQGLGVCFGVFVFICHSQLGFLIELLVNKHCLGPDHVLGWIDLESLPIDAWKDDVCVMRYASFEEGQVELALVQSFGLANVVSHAVSNGGFFTLPGDLKFFKFLEQEERFVEYRPRLGKFLGIAYKSLHWSLLALWLYQVLNLAFAEVEPNDFRYSHFHWIPMVFYFLGIVLTFGFKLLTSKGSVVFVDRGHLHHHDLHSWVLNTNVHLGFPHQ
eukprot:TRINITY_DN2692_c0_g1_i2.p1 TRINITY_DN2692_c0_g1~~TRINITY_DN2692_c0_g1_i2.p1  ORF type:complete len:415 (-),score=83.05 TRINITY_DN2692_c0_g1_i2:83-1327(-)